MIGAFSRSPTRGLFISGTRGFISRPRFQMPNICNGIEKMSLFSNKCSILGLSQQCLHTTSGHAHALKTKKAASKRFIRTGKGGLKGGKVAILHHIRVVIE